MDARVVLSGYLPNYVYDLGATDTSMSFEILRGLSKIHDKAVLADADPNFSARIRQGVPAPIDAAEGISDLSDASVLLFPLWVMALNRCRDRRCAGVPVGGVGSELRARL
jgi:hypothetical protein